MSWVDLQPGFTRDIIKTGHFGIYNLEVSISAPEDMERAKPLFEQSYQAS